MFHSDKNLDRGAGCSKWVCFSFLLVLLLLLQLITHISACLYQWVRPKIQQPLASWRWSSGDVITIEHGRETQWADLVHSNWIFEISVSQPSSILCITMGIVFLFYYYASSTSSFNYNLFALKSTYFFKLGFSNVFCKR